MKNIEAKYREYLKSKSASKEKVELKKEGDYFIWSDLNCLDKDVANWQGMTFLNKTLNKLCKTEDENDIDKLKSSFLYWINNDYINPNWWYNQIGVPSCICDIVILLYDRLTEEQTKKALKIIERGSLLTNESIKKWTGANLIWGIWTTAKHALIIGDSELLKRAVSRASKEIVIAKEDKEGIKSDYSFFQHGPQHYTLGYRRSFTMSLSSLVYILSGTEYQFSTKKLNVLVDFLLNGQIAMMRGQKVDYLAIGREYCRINALNADSIYEAACLYFKTEGIPNKEVIEEFINRYKEQKPYAKGIKYFKDSHFLVNRQEDFYISVKGLSNRVIGTESLNRENLLGYNLSYGTNICCMATGNEYDEMFALWDYSMLPGTTSFVENDEEINKKIDLWANKKGENKSCEGMSQGNVGVMYMEFNNLSISGKVSFIAYENGLIVFGNSITCSDDDNTKEIRTNINQCIAESNFENHGDYVINGAFKYHNLCDKQFIVFTKEVTGNMRRCNLSNPDVNVTKPVFYIGYSHGKNPRDSSFAYCITNKDKESYIQKVINNEDYQGVEFDGFSINIHR